jgi:hypothetical protein
MKRCALLATALSCLAVFSCKDNPANSAVPNAETWLMTVPQSPISSRVTFAKAADSTVVASGWWTSPMDSATVTCHFSECPVTISGVTLTVSLEGMAVYAMTGSSIRDSSDFVMDMSGSFQSGSAQGVWTLMFAKAGWTGASGIFAGTRTDGRGITP